MRKVILLVFLTVLASCKTKQAAVTIAPEVTSTKKVSAEDVIANHYNNTVQAALSTCRLKKYSVTSTSVIGTSVR